jgi:hypothetical protein
MQTGAHDQDRTDDLVLTKDALYQLSYMGALNHSSNPIHKHKTTKTRFPSIFSIKIQGATGDFVFYCSASARKLLKRYCHVNRFFKVFWSRISE